MAETKTAPKKYTMGTGRRKTAVARVRMTEGSGQITIDVGPRCRTGSGISGPANVPVNIIERDRTSAETADGAIAVWVVDLRPGTYAILFRLQGFSSVRREGIVLTANFVAPVNVELQVGTIEETVTVTGDSPIVDVVSSTRQEVLTRELLDAVPTGRDFTTMGNALPSVNMGRFDVGGSSTNQQGTLTAFGGRGEDLNVQIDGMNGANAGWGEGWFTIIYHNEADYQEIAYSTAGSTAENRTGGVVINMIPRVGGNEFRVSSVLTFANDGMQASNIDDDLRSQGFTLEGGLDHLYDTNISVGGPVVRDRTFFFADYEAMRAAEGITKIATVPTESARQSLPAFLTHPVGRAIAALYPAPNRPGRTGNYVTSPTQRDHTDHFDVGRAFSSPHRTGAPLLRTKGPFCAPRRSSARSDRSRHEPLTPSAGCRCLCRRCRARVRGGRRGGRRWRPPDPLTEGPGPRSRGLDISPREVYISGAAITPLE